MNSRIPVTEETHFILRDIAHGLGVNMNEALLFLINCYVKPGDDPLLVGRKLQEEYEEKRDELKKYKVKPKK